MMMMMMMVRESPIVAREV